MDLPNPIEYIESLYAYRDAVLDARDEAEQRCKALFEASAALTLADGPRPFESISTDRSWPSEHELAAQAHTAVLRLACQTFTHCGVAPCLTLDDLWRLHNPRRDEDYPHSHYPRWDKLSLQDSWDRLAERLPISAPDMVFRQVAQRLVRGIGYLRNPSSSRGRLTVKLHFRPDRHFSGGELYFDRSHQHTLGTWFGQINDAFRLIELPVPADDPIDAAGAIVPYQHRRKVATPYGAITAFNTESRFEFSPDTGQGVSLFMAEVSERFPELL